MNFDRRANHLSGDVFGFRRDRRECVRHRTSFELFVLSKEIFVSFCGYRLCGLTSLWPRNASLQEPVLQRLGNIVALDRWACREICDRPRHFQDAVVSARCQTETLCCVQQQ